MKIGKCLQFIMTLFLAILVSMVALMASPLSPELVEKLRAEGKLEEHAAFIKDAYSRGINNPQRTDAAFRLSADKDEVDTVRALVILVDFSDQPYTDGVVAALPSDFDSVLFSEGGLNPTGSMTEFYLENSYGKFYIYGDVYGWYRMPQTYAYYVDGQRGMGSYPHNSQRMVVDAVLAANADINYSLYDTYGPGGVPDGQVDGLFVVHSGPGYEETGNVNDIHSHQWSLGYYAQYLDGVTINTYSTEPEERITSSSVTDMGVFSHEYGHVLGLPDMYDTDYTPSTSAGLGDWSLMAGGSWNGGGRRPAHFDAWCKSYVGFVDPINVTENMVNVEFPQVESEPVVYRLWANGSVGNQYFLVENRQKVGSDTPLPGSGLLIYHVDDSRWGNDDVYHYQVALEQADGLFQLEWANNDGDAADPYPGVFNIRSFDDLTTPDSRSYGGATTQVSVWLISDSDSLMTANLDIEWSRPHLTIDSMFFNDADADGILEPFETVQCIFYFKNDWLSANNAVVSMTSNDPGIQFTTPLVTIPIIVGNGGTGNNSANPIEFIVPDISYPIYDSFFVSVESDEGAPATLFEIEKVIGRTDILIVDDDRGGDYEELYYDDLKKKMAPADIWEKDTQGSPTGVNLNEYGTVIWFTGDTSSDLIQTADITAIKDYLDNGGNLFLTGQWLVNELHNEDSAFLEDYLHARAGAIFFNLIHEGEGGSPIGDGLEVRYNSTTNQDWNLSQEIEVVAPAVSAFNFVNGGPSALSYAGDYKVVYFNWGYEAISNDFTYYDTRDTVIANILYFLSDWSPPTCYDSDGDGYGDPDHPENRCPDDNCPSVYNPDQLDSDGDGFGNACDICPGYDDNIDTDEDGYPDGCDNCPNVYNPNQTLDVDGDGVGDPCDNCLIVENPLQEDSDSDLVGDSCDNCIYALNPSQSDIDADSVGDSCDNCIDVYNPDQLDTDGDNIGDACDYLCGNTNGDDDINIFDVTYLISYLYMEGPPPDPIESADVNNDSVVNIFDVTYLISYLYMEGPEPNCP